MAPKPAPDDGVTFNQAPDVAISCRQATFSRHGLGPLSAQAIGRYAVSARRPYGVLVAANLMADLPLQTTGLSQRRKPRAGQAVNFASGRRGTD